MTHPETWKAIREATDREEHKFPWARILYSVIYALITGGLVYLALIHLHLK